MSIKKLDDGAHKQLRICAAKHGISLEEARQIIVQAISATEKISTVFRKYFGEKKGIGVEVEKHYKPHESIKFS